MTSTSTAQPRARPGRRGPRTAAGKARAAQNALKHGLRAQKYVVLPEEDAAEFAVLEAAMIAELAPVGVLQTVLARRVAVAAWRLARADRIEADLFAERSYGADPNPGLALIRDGNGTRSFETLLRYRGAAMAEFWRALKTLKALQAEQAVAPGAALAAGATRSAPPRPLADGPRPSEPEQPARRLQHVMPEPPPPGGALHEPAAPWLPEEPETGGAPGPAAACRTNPRPQPLLGHTIGADGARPTTAALLQSVPGVAPGSPPGSPSCSPRSPRRGAPGQAREVPGAGPGLLQLTGARTKRIRESEAEHSLGVTAKRTIGIGTGASGPG